MSTNSEANLAKSKVQLEAIGVTVNDALLEAVIKGMGIANESLDSSLVAATDASELARVRTNFLSGKLGQTDDAASDGAIAEVMERLRSFDMKERGAVYYLLVEKFGREDVYSE